MVTTVLYAAPSLMSIALGLPVLLPPVRLLLLCACSYLGALSLAVEPIELDVPYQTYSHVFKGIPSEAAVCLPITSSSFVRL